MPALRLSRLRALTVVAVVIAAAAGAAAKGNPNTTAPYPVTSTVFDTDSFGNATQIQSDDPLTQSAVYVGGNTGVISQIYSGDAATDWDLDLRSSNRGFYLTLSTTAGGAVPGLPAGATFYPGRLISRCFAPTGGTLGYSWFSVTDDANCAMRAVFTWGSTDYILVMSPLYAGTGRASVHCNAFNGPSCKDWTVTPDPNVANAGVANLYSIGHGAKEIFVAACKLTFRMHVTYP